MSTNNSSNNNSIHLEFQLSSDSSINQSIWEQTQLDADLAQSLDISRVNTSDNPARVDSLTGQLITSQPLTSLSTTNYISNSSNDIDSLNDFTNTLTNNNLLLKSSVQPSNTNVSNINNLTQVPFDPKYDIEKGFFVKGGLPNLAPRNIDGVEVDPKRRFIDYELVDNKRGTSGQTWVVIHGWNGDLNQFRE